jgi:hypothetical protein
VLLKDCWQTPKFVAEHNTVLLFAIQKSFAARLNKIRLYSQFKNFRCVAERKCSAFVRNPKISLREQNTPIRVDLVAKHVRCA